MNAKTVAALFEAGRAGAELAGFPDLDVDTIEILPDRDYSWCGVEDDYVEVTEDQFDGKGNSFEARV